MIKKTVNIKPNLVDFGFEEQGKYYWWASWYAEVLGYASLHTLHQSIEKSKLACLQLGISIDNNFIPATIDKKKDIKLTKFACFLIAFHADGRKPIVKRARAYFLNEMEEVNVLLKDQEYLSRITKRKELSNSNKLMAKEARRAHVKDFQFFVNEGYMGMYNHTMAELKKQRGIPAKETIGDYIGQTELIANIFRITLTKERLRSLRNPSERIAAREHWRIGSQIRTLIKRNTGKYPEELPLQVNLNHLQKKLKKAQKELNKIVSNKTLTLNKA